MAPITPLPPFGKLPAGSVVEQKQGGRTVLIVQESPSKRSMVEIWEDGLKVTNRILGRLQSILREMNEDMARTNERLTAGIRDTTAKIKANQHLLDKLLEPPA
jgi:gas vesicle protein